MPNTERLPDIEVTIPATPVSVTLARQVLGGLADASGWRTSFVDDVKLALSEACTNVVVHAYQGREPGPLLLRMWADADALRVVVADEGGWVPPTVGTGTGLGLGLPLMAALSDEVQIRHTGTGSTEVAMTFPIRNADGGDGNPG